MTLGGGGIVWNSSNGSMIFHTTLYRYKISCSPYHNFSSVYTALYDNIVGHLWVSKLSRTCRVIKVIISIYICISC
jgi:hypothetical protein